VAPTGFQMEPPMCLIKMQGVHTTLQTNHEHHFSQTRLLFTAGEALYIPTQGKRRGGLSQA
jgi:hypothetical protein